MVPKHVLEAFGETGSPTRLAGGQGDSWRAGDAVFKQASRADEATWSATLLSTLKGPGFTVPKPKATSDGRWTVDGWTASQFVDGEPAGRNGGRWPETIAACEAFHTALVGIPRPSFLDDRDDPWSIADRMASGELPLEALPPLTEIVARLTGLVTPVDLPSQVIHGDFTANVLFSQGQPPCVIDFSPYWRPAGFAIGVIVADTLTWAVADESIFGLVDHVPGFQQMLIRAELRRMLELDQHARRGRQGMAQQLVEHWRTVRTIEGRTKGAPGSPEAPR